MRTSHRQHAKITSHLTSDIYINEIDGTLSQENNFKADYATERAVCPIRPVSRERGGRAATAKTHAATPTARNTTFDPSPDRNWQPDNRRVVMNRSGKSYQLAPGARRRRSFADSPNETRRGDCHVQARSALPARAFFSLDCGKSKVIFTWRPT